MPVQETDIETFLGLAESNPVFDVRSPGEYSYAHIPGAFSLPIFSDEERKIIGTTYKQRSKEKAIKEGLDFFGTKMKDIVEVVEDNIRKTQQYRPADSSLKVLVHCWRGGMRSNAIAWLLNLYGFDCYLLKGGYKVYRNAVLSQFEKPVELQLLGGYTGSGKTRVLELMHERHFRVIDLERIALHRGSAFGGIGQPEQPTQEMFENILAKALSEKEKDGQAGPIWLEDESQRIGKLNIPHALWNTMREAPVYFLDIPFEERLKHIVEGYSNLDRQCLGNAIERIKKRLGPLETKTALQLLNNGDITRCFSILLSYYDKSYIKSLNNRENISRQLNKIPCISVNSLSNLEKLDACRLQLKYS